MCWLIDLFVYVANVFHLLPNINLATSDRVFNSRKNGSFPNESVDRKGGLNIEVNTARPRSVHSFKKCSRMGVIIPSVNL